MVVARSNCSRIAIESKSNRRCNRRRKLFVNVTACRAKFGKSNSLSVHYGWENLLASWAPRPCVVDSAVDPENVVESRRRLLDLSFSSHTDSESQRRIISSDVSVYRATSNVTLPENIESTQCPLIQQIRLNFLFLCFPSPAHFLDSRTWPHDQPYENLLFHHEW